ncbi:MAG: diaminopimelate decarboxylase [Candidatus Magasanikbacteria bacterium CG_4_10_14_0_2_um_filter_33_14]|uniref:Diaminopimelate decarboxylase n=1 Tax=Candidatus Magasanikbacteria bacterium CG_4_10_14_0_2_um_filter_33_14 TaxID=1974636 RepID=A0A2M7VBN3_9BACT|nr:MAG: diaminopimelate decarboxylase [Candidatus Magasanikbacteria bacterium CG_4_10_14_0_2_um_filter_33_14]
MKTKDEILLEIAQKYSTPTYVYDLAVVRERAKELQTEIGQYPQTEFLYAIKANYNPHLVKEIINLGFGIDAVSQEEVKLGLACGATPDKIMFTGNNMTDDEMVNVHDLGVLLNIGSLSRLEKYGSTYPGSKVSLRFNPNIGIASHESNITGGPDSKFGISFKDVRQALALAQKYNLQIVGIHQHIGSGWLRQREPMLALDVILEIAEQIPGLEFVDVGGGFGVPYSPDQTRLELHELGEKIKNRVTEFCEKYGREIKLRFEPGRYVVAESGYLLTRVNTLKESISRKTIVGTDTGMNHLVRVAMYGSYHPIRNISHPRGFEKEYDITGNICECADFFARDRLLPEVIEGDVLSINNAGAYGFAMASNYQFRALPMEVMIEGEDVRVIRKRESFDDLLSNYNF